jgi:hypothetical protein
MGRYAGRSDGRRKASTERRYQAGWRKRFRVFVMSPRGELPHEAAVFVGVLLAGDDPLAVAATKAVQSGDLDHLRALLNEHPGLARADIGDRGPLGMSGRCSTLPRTGRVITRTASRR